jgi:hypothetical protein
MVYPILKAVMVESLAFPELLNTIFPEVAVTSLTEILRFPAGEVMNPLKAHCPL